ncbi:MAG: alkaline phosphatase family protein, partial [Verrucomicrobia bacterium]|nr:alkaline phosphatase family protein [Verrucomicrobiota bacterium]
MLRFLPARSSFVCGLLILWFYNAIIAAEPPRLVLQLTVDQLRGDQIPRHRDRFGPGGFRLLLDRGRYFANAHYETSNTFTASGHAVLVTGATTTEHGIVANDWFDRDLGRPVYCTADPASPLVGEPAKPGAGQSPAHLTSTTLGDELVAAKPGARAFAVSGKDRSAIIPGGHRGRAFWWSGTTGGFVSSTYYGAELPAWVTAWNATKPIDAYRTQTWRPLGPPPADDGNPHARPPAVLGRSFPHPLLAQSDKLFFGAFQYTPFFDELIATFALELVAREQLGRPGTTDYLSVSFSGHDYIGHAYGPDSPESRDSLLRVDATLARLFAALDRAIGLDRVLIVLSADHGTDDIPEKQRAAGLAAGRHYPDTLRARANAALREKLGVSDDLILSFIPPGFYFDPRKLAAAKLPASTVEAAIAEFLRTVPGIAHAFRRTDLLADALPSTALAAKVRRGFHPQRSGDVVIVQEPYWYLYPEPETY